MEVVLVGGCDSRGGGEMVLHVGCDDEDEGGGGEVHRGCDDVDVGDKVDLWWLLVTGWWHGEGVDGCAVEEVVSAVEEVNVRRGGPLRSVFGMFLLIGVRRIIEEAGERSETAGGMAEARLCGGCDEVGR
ncbi:hypothetical protein Tco_0456190 [Tanacetum coccineum]